MVCNTNGSLDNIATLEIVHAEIIFDYDYHGNHNHNQKGLIINIEITAGIIITIME